MRLRQSAGASAGYLTPFYPDWLVSMRLRNAAYAGPCCRVKNLATTVETDIPFDGNGWCSSSAVAATHTTGQTVGVTKWYVQDASGRDAVQTTDSAMPVIVLGGTMVTLSGHPAIRWDTSSKFLKVPADAVFGFGTGGGALEAFAVGTMSGSHFNNIADFRGSGGSGVPVFFVSTNKKLYYYDGTFRGDVGTVVADSVLHHLEWDISTGAVYQFLNGNLESTSSPVTTNLGATGSLIVGNNTTPNAVWDGVIGEMAVVNGSTLHTSGFTPRSYT